jgi:hypothetical protein
VIRQQQELLELSTQVVVLWRGVLALPLIGTRDSTRTQVVMETLLDIPILRMGEYCSSPSDGHARPPGVGARWWISG